jgi:hypothetical protein
VKVEPWESCFFGKAPRGDAPTLDVDGGVTFRHVIADNLLPAEDELGDEVGEDDVTGEYCSERRDPRAQPRESGASDTLVLSRGVFLFYSDAEETGFQRVVQKLRRGTMFAVRTKGRRSETQRSPIGQALLALLPSNPSTAHNSEPRKFLRRPQCSLSALAIYQQL